MSIYHLHIPRTSGGFIRKSIVSKIDGYNVVGHYRSISDEDFKKASFISGHYGLNPSNFVDRIFTVLRNPNELTFSYIKYLSLVSGVNNFSEDFLKKYLYEDKLRFAVTNVNTKFLSANVNIDQYNKNINNHINMANNLWYLEIEDVSSANAIRQIKDKNILTFFYDSKNLYRDIHDMIGINYNPINISRVNQSFADTEELYEKYFDEISLANNVDLQLYRRFKDEAHV